MGSTALGGSKVRIGANLAITVRLKPIPVAPTDRMTCLEVPRYFV